MIWLVFVGLAAAMWSAHNVSIKILGEAMPPALAVAAFYVIGALTSGAIYLFQQHRAPVATVLDLKLVALIVFAGITIGLTDYFYVTAFAKGAELSLAGPLFGTSGLFLIALAGLALFGEALTLAKIAGFALAAAGIFLMAR